MTDLQQAVGHSWHSLQQQGPHTQALQAAAAVAQTDPQAYAPYACIHNTEICIAMHADALKNIKSCD